MPSIIEITLLRIHGKKKVSYNQNANAQLDRVCWYTLPGENEIRTEITRLFERKKGSDKDDIGSAEMMTGLRAEKAGDKAIYPGNI